MSKSRRPTSAAPPPSTSREQGLVPISCPDCFGVLRFEREGPKAHLLYRCQVDHRYTTGSLVHSKEAQVERTLWSAVLLLTQLIYAYEDRLEEIDKAGRKRAEVRRRIDEVKKQCLAVRAMIEAAHVAE